VALPLRSSKPFLRHRSGQRHPRRPKLPVS
jgi:hypothetical protein